MLGSSASGRLVGVANPGTTFTVSNDQVECSAVPILGNLGQECGDELVQNSWYRIIMGKPVTFHLEDGVCDPQSRRDLGNFYERFQGLNEKSYQASHSGRRKRRDHDHPRIRVPPELERIAGFVPEQTHRTK